MKTYSLIEVCAMTGLPKTKLQTFIEEEWIKPVELESFDQEDVARVKLILELSSDLGVNAESIPIILHLIDQLHCIRHHFLDNQVE